MLEHPALEIAVRSFSPAECAADAEGESELTIVAQHGPSFAERGLAPPRSSSAASCNVLC